MRRSLTEGQLNTASWHMQDFNTETGGSVEDFAWHFYEVAIALGYDSRPFVELMEKKFAEECSEVISYIKVSEGW